jgi:ATP-dependent DNA ligase
MSKIIEENNEYFMKYPILYKRTAKGQKYQWEIKVSTDNSDYEEADEVYLVKSYGVVNGKIQVQRRKVIAKGKNTEWEQGVKEAKKAWNDRIKKDGYTENINEERTYYTPMLAQTLKFKKGDVDMKYPFYVQPKLDGFRCMVNFNKEEKKINLVSRKNIAYNGLPTLKEILLNEIFSILPEKGYGSKDLYLDGELFISSVPFEQLSGKIKRAQYNDDYDIPDIQFHLFDCFDTGFFKEPFSKRTKFLKSIIPKSHKNLLYVPTDIVKNTEEMKQYFSKYLADGHEGLMARVGKSEYKPNKRPSCLKKYKEMMDSEFEIVGYNEAKGSDKGTVIWVCKTDTDQIFTVRPKGTREMRKDWFNNGDKYIGKQLTVIYQELSELGVPRFPVGKAIRD